jgi:hypothetical protein
MAASHDRMSADEWLMSFLRGVTRWASTGAATTPAGQSPRGCLHPVSLLKLVVFLLVLVLCPLFMLPFLLIRLARFGVTGVKYSASVDMTSGEAARWGYSVLEPVAEGRYVQDGLGAIGHDDPGFRAGRLTGWATSAGELIWQSMVRGDPAPVRTFMSSGLFSNHCALLELRATAEVACQGSWQATSAAVVEATRTPLYEQVRVRLRCDGWCWERHAGTGLTLRGGPEAATWSEDLTFGRLAGARTPGFGGLPDGRCPSCGAALELDPAGACRYCHSVVTAGQYDWVLTSWRRDPW